MYSNYQKTNAVPSPLTFTDGTKFTCRPITDRDLSELDEWVQSRVVATAQRSLSTTMSQTERDEVLRVAMMVAVDVSWIHGRGSRIMATVDGMSRLLWHMIRRDHPEITPDELRSKLFNPDSPDRAALNIETAMRKFKEMNDVPGVAPSDAHPLNRHERRTRDKKRKKQKK